MRTLDALLSRRGTTLDAVIALRADIDELVARLLRRAATDGRSDDNEPTIRIRQQPYLDQTAPLLALYRERDLLLDVDGLGTIDEVASRLASALDDQLDQRKAAGAATP